AAFAGLRLGPGNYRVDLRACGSGGEGDIVDAELGEDFGHETFARSVERARMDEHVPGLAVRPHEAARRGHAAGEHERVRGPVPYAQSAFENFLVRPVEARVDRAFGTSGALAGKAFEVALSRLGILEHERAGQKGRRLERPFRKHRVVAVTHHQGRRLELAPANLGYFGFGLAALDGTIDGL